MRGKAPRGKTKPREAEPQEAGAREGGKPERANRPVSEQGFSARNEEREPGNNPTRATTEGERGTTRDAEGRQG